MTVYERIETLRKERKITQESLANYLGITKAAVSKWELNQSYPDITLLPIIASFVSNSETSCGVKNSPPDFPALDAYIPIKYS